MGDNPPSDAVPKVLVGICTYNRPKMLTDCLASCAQLETKGLDVQCLIANNTPSTPIDEGALASVAPLIARVVEVQEQGIPFARNAILDQAEEGGFDYCVFIDDDECPKSDWLVELVAHACEKKAQVVQGNVIYQYESKPWLVAPLLRAEKFGEKAEHKRHGSASTCNVLIHRQLFASEGKRLRFDESMQYSGGTDSDFFRRAHDEHLVNILYHGKAEVYETIPASKSTPKALFLRRSRTTSNLFHIRRNLANRSHYSQILRDAPKHLGGGVVGLLLAALSLPCFIIPHIGRNVFLSGFRGLAKCHGYLSAVLGGGHGAYRTNHGR